MQIIAPPLRHIQVEPRQASHVGHGFFPNPMASVESNPHTTHISPSHLCPSSSGRMKRSSSMVHHPGRGPSSLQDPSGYTRMIHRLAARACRMVAHVPDRCSSARPLGAAIKIRVLSTRSQSRSRYGSGSKTLVGAMAEPSLRCANALLDGFVGGQITLGIPRARHC